MKTTIAIAVLFWMPVLHLEASANIVCTSDLKICPDGSSLSRDQLDNFEFPECDSCIHPLTNQVGTEPLLRSRST